MALELSDGEVINVCGADFLTPAEQHRRSSYRIIKIARLARMNGNRSDHLYSHFAAQGGLTCGRQSLSVEGKVLFTFISG